MADLAHIPSTSQIEEIAPGERLRTDPARAQLIRVTEGVLYVRLDKHDVVLTPGDSLTIPAGEPRHAWNAGDDRVHAFVCDAETGCPEALALAGLAKAA
jgi:quercetin dioxygenase-like cupin family protein